MPEFPSLKEQIIKAFVDNEVLPMSTPLAEKFFDTALWPVLDAAMEAGRLLVSRATQPSKSVPEAIVAWLEGVLEVVDKVHKLEATASKAELLKMLYQLEYGARKALDDVQKMQG